VTAPSVPAVDSLRRWTEPLFLALLIVLSVVAGMLTSQRWTGMDSGFYGVISQLIATLFIAITVEFFAQLPRSWKGTQERIAIFILIVMSWTGLFACITALVALGAKHAGEVPAWLAGFAGSGLLAAAAVVSLSFTERLRGKDRPRQTLIAVAFVVPPVVLLFFI
jgi:hypothetical protein